MRTWLIDAGHGGIDHNGNYTTAPSKMYEHPEFTINEGEINRKIANKLMALLFDSEIKYRRIHANVIDTGLRERTDKANELHEIYRDCVYLSIHSNAGGGKGFESFVHPNGSHQSKTYCANFQNELIKLPFRNRGVKESNFYVLRETNCPAVLVELLFFDNLEEAKYLTSEKGQNELATALFNAILKVENIK